MYFPHRDTGFDFIISKRIDGTQVLRPVQVKGKYPTAEKGDKATYGYIGELTELHPEMVLAIPFFSSASPEVPNCVAYMPRSMVRNHSRGFKCEPALFRGGSAIPRREYKKFFDEDGLHLIEQPEWSTSVIVDAAPA